jgi:hypothetical protein
MSTTKKIFEKLQGVESADIDPASDAHYQETIAWLLEWNGDADALLKELERRRRARKMPALPELDMTNKFDDGVLFVEMVERVAERLSVGVVVPVIGVGKDTEDGRRESDTARLLRQKNLR